VGRNRAIYLIVYLLENDETNLQKVRDIKSFMDHERRKVVGETAHIAWLRQQPTKVHLKSADTRNVPTPAKSHSSSSPVQASPRVHENPTYLKILTHLQKKSNVSCESAIFEQLSSCSECAGRILRVTTHWIEPSLHYLPLLQFRATWSTASMLVISVWWSSRERCWCSDRGRRQMVDWATARLIGVGDA